MSGMFSRCMCTPAARVFWNAGQVYCTRCLSARSLLSPELQDTDLGAVGLFHKPKDKLHWKVPIGIPQVECSPSGCCWLSTIFPLARMTSGNHNFLQRLVKVADVLYRDGCLTPRHLRELQVYERGCNWYPITGPVPGMAVYANSMHVSDQPFPGATHVLTNSPLPQRACRQPFCPFEEAHSSIYRWEKFVIFMDSSSDGRSRMMWTPESDDSTALEVLPPELEHQVKVLVRSFPAHHLVDLADWELTESPDNGFSFSTSHPCGYLVRDPAVSEGKCWLSCFLSQSAEVLSREAHLATAYGYQTKWGVPGKYIQRRLQVHGLRAVVDPDGPIHVEALSCPQSWIRHLTLNDDVTPGFVRLMSLRIVPNTEPTTHRIFRFGVHKWYGAAGKRARGKRAAKSEKDSASTLKVARPTSTSGIVTYSPPADGSCGWHALAAILNRMINNDFTSPLPRYNRPEDDWASDGDLAQAIQCLQLPAAIARNRACPNAKYLIKLNGVHWEVEVRPGMAPRSLSRECVVGVCSEGCVASPYPEDGLPKRALEALASAYRLPSDCVCDGIIDFLANPPPQEFWTLDKMLTSPSPEQSGFSSLYKLLLEILPQKCGSTEGEFIYTVERMLKDCPSSKQAMALLAKIKVPSSKAPSVTLNECFPTDVPVNSELISWEEPKDPGAAVVLCPSDAKESKETAPEEAQARNRKVLHPVVLTEELSEQQVQVVEGDQDMPLDLTWPTLTATATPVRGPVPDNLSSGIGAQPATVQELILARPAPRLVERCGTESNGSSSFLDLPDVQTSDQPLDLSLAAWPVRATASDPGWIHGRREPVFVKPRGVFSDGESALQFGELSEASSVVDDRTKEAPVVDAPIDLTTSNETLSGSDPFEFAKFRRPRFSAQALIDRGGPLADVHAKIKSRVYEQCLQACEPGSRATPATKKWLDKMWDRVDMKTWRCTSQFQAGHILESLKFLPDMIQDTPPPVPRKNRAGDSAGLKQLVAQWDRKSSVTPPTKPVGPVLDQAVPLPMDIQQGDAISADKPPHSQNPSSQVDVGGGWKSFMLSGTRFAGSVSQRLTTWVFLRFSPISQLLCSHFSRHGALWLQVIGCLQVLFYLLSCSAVLTQYSDAFPYWVSFLVLCGVFVWVFLVLGWLLLYFYSRLHPTQSVLLVTTIRRSVMLSFWLLSSANFGNLCAALWSGHRASYASFLASYSVGHVVSGLFSYVYACSQIWQFLLFMWCPKGVVTSVGESV
uniref:NSP2TF n=1 Tax=Porcine reproductive and respiratory syndrome virus TaxID=28344 RepID=A0A0U2VWV1_PRRSV|nr:NSP2TF [Porcine reproductive and respiratory syndrome virus]